jgi:hypothetical protein
MIGFVFRAAVAVKELGERSGISPLIRIALAVRELILGVPVRYFI